jgi:ketosteroid isomerase-like protein
VTDESATPDPVESARRLVDAINAGDFDAFASVYAHYAVWDARRSGGRLEGREAIRGSLEEWFGIYDDFKFEADELCDLGHRVGFAVLRQHARLPGTTAWVQDAFPLVSIWSVGLIQRVTSYFDIDEARAAAERLVEERG